MKLNLDNLKKIFKEDANCNYNKFARLLKIDVGLLYRIINNQSGAGVKTINAVIDYCKETDRDYKRLIFLD